MNIDKIKKAFREEYMELTAFPANQRTANCSQSHILIEEGTAGNELEAAKKLGRRVAFRENNYAAKRLLEMKESYEEIECNIDEIENKLNKTLSGGYFMMHPILRAALEKRKKAEWIYGETHSEFYAFGRRIFPVGTIGESTIIALPEDLPYLDYNGEDSFEEKEGLLIVKRQVDILFPEGEKFNVIRVEPERKKR